jgi:hypothetical protein
MWSGADVFGPSDLCSRAATGRCGSVRTGAFRVIPFDVTPQFLGRLVGQSHRGDANKRGSAGSPGSGGVSTSAGGFPRQLAGHHKASRTGCRMSNDCLTLQQ